MNPLRPEFSDELIKEINAVRLGPGDVLVVKYEGMISQNMRVSLLENLRQALPNKKILLMPDIVTFEVITPEALGEMVKDEIS